MTKEELYGSQIAFANPEEFRKIEAYLIKLGFSYYDNDEAASNDDLVGCKYISAWDDSELTLGGTLKDRWKQVSINDLFPPEPEPEPEPTKVQMAITPQTQGLLDSLDNLICL